MISKTEAINQVYSTATKAFLLGFAIAAIIALSIFLSYRTSSIEQANTAATQAKQIIQEYKTLITNHQRYLRTTQLRCSSIKHEWTLTLEPKDSHD